MAAKKFQRALNSLLVYESFFMSNYSAMVSVVWLVPGLVYLETGFWLIFSAISLWILARDRSLSLLVAALRKNWIVLPFLLYAGLSIVWSVDWSISLARWLILAATILIGAYVGLQYETSEIIRLLSRFCAVILGLSAILILVAPHAGVMNYYTIQGAWKGIYWHKNHMGMIAAFANILFLISTIQCIQSRSKLIWWWGALCIFSLAFIYQTDSVGAYLTLICLYALIVLSLIYLRVRASLRVSHFVTLGALLLVGSLALYANLDHVFALFNRNTSLTGRVPMWQGLFHHYLGARPLEGYGFNAFWYVEAHRITMQYLAGYPDQIVIADNGFIDILINTGVLGLGLFLAFYLSLWGQALRAVRTASDLTGVFPLVVMAYTLVANISWSLLFEDESFFMLIMMAVMFSLTRLPLKLGREQGREEAAPVVEALARP